MEDSKSDLVDNQLNIGNKFLLLIIRHFLISELVLTSKCIWLTSFSRKQVMLSC